MAALLLLAALLPRLPAIGLPLEREGAAAATRAERLVEEGSLRLSGRPAAPPLAPVLTAAGVLVGLTPTATWRVLCAAAAVLLAPLILLLGTAFGLRWKLAFCAGLLVAWHPLLATHAGGPAAEGQALAGALLLGALWLLAAPSSARRRRGAAACLAFLPLAEPLAVVYVPGLLFLVLRQESSGRARAALLGVVALALLVTPWPAVGTDGPGLGSRILVGGLVGLPLLGLVVLLPFVPRGTCRLLTAGRGVVAAWLVGTLVHLGLLLALPLASAPRWSWEGLGGGVLLVPAFVLVGLGGVRATRRRRVGGAALTVAVAGTLFAILGPVQTAVLPDAPPAAGRLHRLGRAIAAAKEAAGEDGWVGLDLRPGRVLEERRLADLASGRAVGRLYAGGAEAPEALPPLPLGDLPVGTFVGAVLRHRPEMLEVTTEGGRGIYLREPVARHGPWVVVKIRRP